jgi:hypothetical protein
MTVTGSFYALADALQMPIHYDGNGIVRGASRGLIPGLPTPTPVQLIAKAMFLKEQVGVLVHVKGDLYVIVAHNPDKGGTSAFLLNRAHMPVKLESVIQKNMNLREAVGAVRPAIVKAFALRKGQWTPMNLPPETADAHALDELQGRQP